NCLPFFNVYPTLAARDLAWARGAGAPWRSISRREVHLLLCALVAESIGGTHSMWATLVHWLNLESRHVLGAQVWNSYVERLNYEGQGIFIHQAFRGVSALVAWWPVVTTDQDDDLQRPFLDEPNMLWKRWLTLQTLRGAFLFLADPGEVGEQVGEYCLVSNLRKSGAAALILRQGVPDYSLPGARWFLRSSGLVSALSHARDQIRDFPHLLVSTTTISRERGTRILIARPLRSSHDVAYSSPLILFGGLLWASALLILWAKAALRTRTIQLSLAHQLPLFFVLVFLPSLWLSEQVINRSRSESEFNLEETGRRTLNSLFLAMDDSYHLIIQWAVSLFATITHNGDFLTRLAELESNTATGVPAEVTLAPFQRISTPRTQGVSAADDSNPVLRRIAEQWFRFGFSVQYLLAHLPHRAPLGFAMQNSEFSGLKTVGALFSRFAQEHMQRANPNLETAHLDPKKEMLVRAELDEIINVIRNLTPAERSSELFMSPRGFSEILFFKGQTNVLNMGIVRNGVTRYYLQTTAIYTQFLRHLMGNFHRFHHPDLRVFIPLAGSTFDRQNRVYRQPFLQMIRNGGEIDFERFENRQSPDLGQAALMTAFLQDMVWGRSSTNRGEWLYAAQASQNIAQFLFTGLFPLDQALLELAGTIRRQRALLFAVLAFAITLAFLIARRLLMPLHQLRHACDEVTHERYGIRLPDTRGDEFGELGRVFNFMVTDIASGRLLGTFVSESLRDAVKDMDESLDPQAEVREVTVLFITLSDWKRELSRIDANALIQTLNVYLEQTTRLIRQYGGAIDKILGEKVLAVFSATQDVTREIAALNAVRCARHLINYWRHHAPGPQYPPAIGLVSGTALAGILGTKEVRLDFTVIGDTVNLASRLCDLACTLPQAGLVLDPESISMMQASPGFERQLEFERLPIRSVKGKRREVEAYRLVENPYS
ncbi:MAG TPA: adenylate/guanylate cyclase domain-containing protein, partial [Candidatus Ozemobacteraceae bacterium]|nr:adenylate/guanylate cyclase domain-containing protein [Candidatus Ozemobacteraceae bacterium]